MKIIFLDIDGVLNSQLFFTQRNNGELSTHDVGFCGDIDPRSVAYLNSIIAGTGAKVVVSSTWRLGRTIEELQEILNKAGFKGEVIDKTEDLKIGEHSDSILRGNEILAWTKDNQGVIGCYYNDFKTYVILDDDSDMLYWQRNNYIQVDPFVGLTPTSVFKAKKILNQYEHTQNSKS